LEQITVNDFASPPAAAHVDPSFSWDALRIDPAAEAARIEHALRGQVLRQLRRRGVVLGLSGGVDSSVVAALCVRALGPRRVFGLFMPERDTDPDSLYLGRLLARRFGIDSAVEDLTPMLDAAGCYARRDAFIRELFPEYGPGYKSKLVLPGKLEGLDRDQGFYNVFSLVIESPQGERRRARLPLHAYLGIVAATNMKQRSRKQLEYYHADRLNYAVAGTPNRLEYDQGFFVKNGDGAADIKPIAHLYKCQVYQLAEYLGVPEEIRRRPPSTDTYSLPQTQEEFFFSAPLDKLDLCLFALNHGVPPARTAVQADLSVEQVERIYRDILDKRRSGQYQHFAPLLVEPVGLRGDSR
jgi:NAD+ synthase